MLARGGSIASAALKRTVPLLEALHRVAPTLFADASSDDESDGGAHAQQAPADGGAATARAALPHPTHAGGAARAGGGRRGGAAAARVLEASAVDDDDSAKLVGSRAATAGATVAQLSPHISSEAASLALRQRCACGPASSPRAVAVACAPSAVAPPPATNQASAAITAPVSVYLGERASGRPVATPRLVPAAAAARPPPRLSPPRRQAPAADELEAEANSSPDLSPRRTSAASPVASRDPAARMMSMYTSELQELPAATEEGEEAPLPKYLEEQWVRSDVLGAAEGD